MKILLVNNRLKEKTEYMARQIAQKFSGPELEILIDDPQEAPVREALDLIMVLGGDGTMLRAARRYGQENIPLLGVNMGTVGFLSNIEAQELESYFGALVKGEYAWEQRMMLQIEMENPEDRVWGLNEVILRSHTPRMISFQLEMGDQKLPVCRGDGVIIATPTGSTAYSLSAGGPIVDPALNAFIITPLASYYLDRRPFLVGGEQKLKLKLLGKQDACLCVDGQVKYNVAAETELSVQAAPVKLRLVKLKPGSLVSVIERTLQRG